MSSKTVDQRLAQLYHKGQDNIWVTDPNNEDTDGDGYSDKEEIDKGYDPTDPDSHPSSDGGDGGGFLPVNWIVVGIGFLSLAIIRYNSKSR